MGPSLSPVSPRPPADIHTQGGLQTPALDTVRSNSTPELPTGNLSPDQTLTNVPRLHSPPGTPPARLRSKSSSHRRPPHISTNSGLDHEGAGAEPGINVRHSSSDVAYGHIKERCVVQVIDYNSRKANFKTLDNEGVRTWLFSEEGQRPPWAKVRWINVAGISWDVVSCLGLNYDLHPLALEDVLHERSQARSKADYYSDWLFLRILSQLHGDEDPAELPTVLDDAENQVRTPQRMNSASNTDSTFWGGEKVNSGSLWSSLRKRHVRPQGITADLEASPSKSSSRTLWSNRRRRKHAAQQATLDELKKGERVTVLLRNAFIFLRRDGTVISFHQDPHIDLVAPIVARLQQQETVLRRTAEASLLVYGLLDLIVDKALEVMDAYHQRIMKLEKDVLLRPSMAVVRHLHIISGDLILHKRSMEPLKALIYGLRRYDLDRCIAIFDSLESGHTDKREVKGYMSNKAKVYLADVQDHVEQVLSSMDMFAAIAENLISYSFNMASSSTNEVMRRFTIVTIVCLPLTLLTGYFGMNFTDFPAIDRNDIYFWEIAIPLIAALIPILFWSDISRMLHYIQRKAFTERLEQAYQQH
ncbi:hypothetical protein SISSUDRAFT_1020114 [Sistotremastrum suecicum HHB10207 ss-3]|uniref:Cora-domain-containing protein n=1 Tax=Sistotremastrum suecicum HHB10207 ss-3 TaxID=1314776 RepID=A0A166EEB8_9AGAM|nr:hypothetical protein SISSUDRAFT_1020114 [Sistotremastrum suecicum HHB10207 ss-3]